MFCEPSNIVVKVRVCWSVVGVSWDRKKCVLLSHKVARTNPELLGCFFCWFISAWRLHHTSIYPSGQSAMPRTSKAKSARAKHANFASAFKKVRGEVLNGSRGSARSSAKVAKQSSLALATRRHLAAAGAGASSDEVDSDDSADESYSDQDASKLVNGTVVTAEERYAST